MIQVIHYQHESIEKSLEAAISRSYDEVRKLLPGLPENIQIYFSDYGILPDSGIGGYAYSPGIITISIDPDFKDKQKQFQDLRPTIFHESFHLLQNFTGASPPYAAIENALYEGIATIFEREYAGVFESYGDYRQIAKSTLHSWIQELEKISAQDFTHENVYRPWKFYHPDYKERWIAYKVGTYMTDHVLEKHELNILELSTKTAAEVLALYHR